VRHRFRLGLSFDMPHGWMVRVDDGDRAVCCLVEDRHIDISDLSPVIGIFSFPFSGGFHEWVADLMRRRGTTQPPLLVTVGGRAALAYDWTDGVADVYSAFVALDVATTVEFEFSSRMADAVPGAVEERGRTVLDSVHWCEGLGADLPPAAE
jgi:hypothetical protein